MTAVTSTGSPAAVAGDHPTRGGRRRGGLAWLGALPFLAYVGLFLLLPTALVLIEAFFTGTGQFTWFNVSQLTQDYVVHAFVTSIELSAASASIGAVWGALLAYALATGRPDGVLRRVTTAACGVLAQFGGVPLAFAFIATIGGEGLVTRSLADAGWDIYSGGVWLYELPGLVLVYSYFQIPLMVLVFLPAVDGIRPQWREATESLGGSSWDFWRHVGVPLLTPPFLGALLLLFANAFSAYATAAALISQGGVIVPLQIANTFSSEVVLGQENVGKALALGMIVIVALVMTGYALLQRRTARWLR